MFIMNGVGLVQYSSRSLKILSILGLVWFLLGGYKPLWGVTNPGQYIELENATRAKAKLKLREALGKYCGEFCEVLKVTVQIDEKIPDGEDMGFESTVDSSSEIELVVSNLTALVQVDERIGNVNKRRLSNILTTHLKSLSQKASIQWKTVKLPRITRYGEGQPGFIFDSYSDDSYGEGDWDFRPQDYTGMALKLRNRMEQRIRHALKAVIQTYCPDQCIIEKIDIQGGMVSPKDTIKLDRTQQIRDKSGRSIFQIDNIDLDITIDSALSEDNRAKITNIMRAKIRFASPINFNIGVVDFPETHAKKKARENEDLNDPYGLNKLRNMLIMFRDLASTKEVIRTNTESSQESREESSDSISKASDLRDLQAEKGMDLEELSTLIFGGLLILGLIVYFLLKVRQSNRDAEEMISNQTYNIEQPDFMGGRDEAGKDDVPESSDDTDKENLLLTMKIQELKDELIDLFVENPKVAKETFSRFLKEDGVEDTAKYVHVFGHLIVFELLKDPNLQRELYELSEYYHNSDFNFTLEEEYDLLIKLKTRCTASEIRVLTRKSSEKFDFLNKLDAPQVYALICDEKIQVQAIVLTQLERKKRNNVFDMYVGQTKVDLMNELSNADAIPKDFLFNVAKVLRKKVTSRPEFDTENLRTSDILLDLMEKAPLQEQKSLMSTLQEKNPETARSLKMKLVTVNMLPYLKDGHLLELILGMDREDLLMFLAGTYEEIKDLLLRKAPEELADSWIEDMEMMASVDEPTFRLVEMKVKNKIRSLANNGVISLLEINGLIFDEIPDNDFVGEAEAVPEMNGAFEAA